MPIYAYRCESCGFEKDVLRKMSDAPLTQCPQCEKDSFRKQVTAAGFQLKGSGWYVTDFRGGSKGTNGSNASTNDAATAPSESKSEAKAETKSDSASTPPAASSTPSATDA
jgi:putative FmdB family regulatory protein